MHGAGCKLKLASKTKKMKSSPSELKNRGYLTASEYKTLHDSTLLNIRECLTDKQAFIRTAAIRKIAKDRNYDYIDDLCILLQSEKKLYTKIEICNCLIELKEKSLTKLLPLIGKIGKNQHTKICSIDLKKQSYPLPRDIVARTIIRMGPEVFVHLETVLDNQNESVLSEVIDIIGHITFQSEDFHFETKLLSLYKTNPSILIQWKLIRSFQAFNSNAVTELLQSISKDSNLDNILRKEAERSYNRIEKRLM